ncbi:SdpI family protein [Acidithiobacillus marinus]|nr:SdpI family protein [Acidithiobacillus marinus]
MMNNGFLSFFICMIGLIALLAALPLYFQKIRPNGFYGIRVPKALESEEAWYAINKMAGGKIAVGGSIMIASGILILFLHQIEGKENQALVIVMVMTVALLGGASSKILRPS